MYSTHSALYKNCTSCCRSCRSFPVCKFYICVFIYLASGWLTTMEEGLAPYLKNKINFPYSQLLAYLRDKNLPLLEKCQEPPLFHIP